MSNSNKKCHFIVFFAFLFIFSSPIGCSDKEDNKNTTSGNVSDKSVDKAKPTAPFFQIFNRDEVKKGELNTHYIYLIRAIGDDDNNLLRETVAHLYFFSSEKQNLDSMMNIEKNLRGKIEFNHHNRFCDSLSIAEIEPIASSTVEKHNIFGYETSRGFEETFVKGDALLEFGSLWLSKNGGKFSEALEEGTYTICLRNKNIGTILEITFTTDLYSIKDLKTIKHKNFYKEPNLREKASIAMNISLVKQSYLTPLNPFDYSTLYNSFTFEDYYFDLTTYEIKLNP